MKKALLVGNGFTSNLNSDYGNSTMMNTFRQRMPDLIDKAEKQFSIFRNLSYSNGDLCNISEALFCGDSLFCGEGVYPSDDGIHIKDDCKSWVIEKLTKLEFADPEKTFKEYFEDYGLLYSINKGEIVGVETYLKVVHMFIEIGVFNQKDYDEVKLVANEVYYNEGKHGKSSIKNQSINFIKLADFLLEFEDIYTTNYDTILDDFLETVNRYPFHLHGGFSINHLNKNPDGRYLPNEAKLIWGINAESKYNELRVGFDFSDFRWDAFRWGDSQVSDYFKYLEEREYDEIHILGFSGENDDHINKRIIENQHIKNIVLYVSPSKVNELETQVRSRMQFSGQKKPVNLKSWQEFWDKVEIDRV